MDKQYLVLLPFAFLGGFIGYKLKIPAGTVIFSLLAVASVKLLMKMEQSSLPPLVNFIPQALVGLVLGIQFSRNVLVQISKMWGFMILSVIVLVAAGLLMAVFFMKMNVLDVQTAYLGTSPGALSAMIFLAVDQKVDAPLVAIFHLFRIFFILLTGPIILKLMTYFQ
jgi:membrane AbrB-like protein